MNHSKKVKPDPEKQTMDINTINIICSRGLNIARLNYTIDFINGHPLKPDGTDIVLNSTVPAQLEINYGNIADHGYYLPAQFLLFGGSQADAGNVFANSYLFQGNTVYSVEASVNGGGELVLGKSFAFDVFEAIFFHISRFEEVFAAKNQIDIQLRMKMEEQFLVKNGLHHIPVVDHLVINFFRALGFHIGDRATQYSLSHDIDAIKKFNSLIKLPKSIGRVFLMGLGLNGVVNIIKWYLKTLFNSKNDPYYVFDMLLTPSNKFENKIIFFVAGGSTRFDLYNSNYLKWLPNVNALGVKMKYKTGFHPSYKAYNDDTMFRQELELLRSKTDQEVKYLRTHFLRVDFQKTFRLAQENGLLFDSSIGYNDDFGFRCGTGFGYYLYDYSNEKAYNVKELPLTIMDSSVLFYKCNENTECFREKLMDFIDKNRYNTHICINFHNSTFDKSLASRSNMKAIYNEMLEILTK